MNRPITKFHCHCGLRQFHAFFGSSVTLDKNDTFVKPFAHIADVFPVGYIGHDDSGNVVLVDSTGDSDRIMHIFKYV